MKTKKKRKKYQSQPKSNLVALRQVCQLIPSHLVARLAREHGVDKLARKFTPWSHVVSMLFAQLSSAVSLNDVCDNLRIHAGRLSAIRGAHPPSRNALSNANKKREADMAEALFWATLEHLDKTSPGFRKASGKRKRGLPRRFKRAVHAIDSSTIQLVASAIDWARHRRRKAAAKLHLRLDVGSFLPGFVIVGTASEGDSSRARELCAGILAGEIAVFDRAYVDFRHLHDLDGRGVNWVTRTKKNMAFRAIRRNARKLQGNILRDDTIALSTPKSKRDHPGPLRRIVANVEVDGRIQEMEFITNNFVWAASSVCEIYRSRWEIEVFFKQIKQNLKLCDFLGNSANAVRWQVWTALLGYVLLRYLAFTSSWPHSFSRLCAMVRGQLWNKIAIVELLKSYGTAGGRFRMLGRPDQAYLPGFT